MHQIVVGVHDAVVQIGRLLAVVEEQQLVGALVDLGVRRDTPVEREPTIEVLFAPGLAGVGIDPIQIAALVETGQCCSTVHHDVGARGVLEERPGTPAVIDLRQRQRFGQPGPQRASCLLLGFKAIGAHETVAVERFSVTEADDVHHSIAIEGVIALQRRV